MIDFTLSWDIGCIFSGGTELPACTGSKKPLGAAACRWISVTHLVQLSATQPGTTSLAGPPCSCVRGASFMRKATSVSSRRA
jgi:hypothetical protein